MVVSGVAGLRLLTEDGGFGHRSSRAGGPSGLGAMHVGFGERRYLLAYTPTGQRRPFRAPGWNGPSVVLKFESSAEPRSVYEFYGERATTHGWSPTLKGSLHIDDRWQKTYPNGAQAWLSIITDRPWERAPEPRQYTLIGSISLPRGTR